MRKSEKKGQCEIMVNVSTSPHVRSGLSTSTVMRDVAIATMPALAFGVFVFGLRALIIIALCAVCSVLTEFVYEKLMKLPVTVADGSALVTGLILAMNLPSTVPFWVPVLGSVFAILFVKQLFGGIGQNFMNPALGARCFLLISFPAILGGTWQTVGNLFGTDALDGFIGRLSTLEVDATSMATPLAVLQGGGEVDLLQTFFGLHTGCIGEVSSVAILIGAVYMIARGVISPRIPAVYVGSAVAFAFLLNLLAGNGAVGANYLIGQTVTGGLLAGAVFMATDYVSSPITRGGQWIYAMLIGFLTALFRVFGTAAEGVSYAIIIGNTLVPLIERVSMPRAFGHTRKGGAVR